LVGIEIATVLLSEVKFGESSDFFYFL